MSDWAERSPSVFHAIARNVIGIGARLPGYEHNGVCGMVHDKDNPSFPDDEDRFHEIDEGNFEKIKKGERGNFPTSTERKARRSSKETFGSKKVRKSISSQGGMHRRRKKKIV